MLSSQKGSRAARHRMQPLHVSDHHSSSAAVCSTLSATVMLQCFHIVRWVTHLVDPASSHMLVSKIKPCMSKHKLVHSEAANGSLGHP